ncbi:class I SAM-dependent methyltransferase [Sutcliffiella cohnii]
MSKREFLKHFIYSPGSIGSITPSSKRLAKKMIHYAGLNKDSIVVELGAGTGVITETILQSVHLSNPIVLFENNEKFVERLKKFGHSIQLGDAFTLSHELEHLHSTVDVVFCGLPLFNFPIEKVDNLLHQIDTVLKPGGKLIGFQYTPVLLSKFDSYFENTYIDIELLNLPPAFVYVCKKKVESERGVKV